MIITLDDALATGRGTERAFNCPVHEDRNASASVNVVKGVWYCYSCHSHGEIEDHVPTVDEALAILRGDAIPRVYPPSWLDLFDADHSSPYWVERFGIDVAGANRCGTDPLTGNPTYPLYDDQQRLVGVVTRHADDKPKYRYPWATSTARMLYGPARPTKVLVLVEGAADVMAMQQGREPKGMTTRGVYGSAVHFPQVELIARMAPEIIVTAFDDDEAGRAGMALALENEHLSDIARVVSHRWTSVRGASDPAELPASTRIKAIKDTLHAVGYDGI